MIIKEIKFAIEYDEDNDEFCVTHSGVEYDEFDVFDAQLVRKWMTDPVDRDYYEIDKHTWCEYEPKHGHWHVYDIYIGHLYISQFVWSQCASLLEEVKHA